MSSSLRSNLPGDDPRVPVPLSRVVRCVVTSQLLFTAGNALTTGGFLNYFVKEFDPTALLLAAVMTAPEMSQAVSVFGRWVALRRGNRKRIWIRYLLLARTASLLIPLALIWPGVRPNQAPIWWILAWTIIWYVLQGIAYVNYISWLSDLAPETNWGRLFSRRQIADRAIALIVAVTAAWARERYLDGLPAAAERWSFAVIFLVGGLLTMLSILPMLWLPHVPWRPAVPVQPLAFLKALWTSHPIQWLLASRWWLGFFQGLTQAVFFNYTRDVLHINLLTYYGLNALMLGLHLPLAWWAGRLSDQSRDRFGFAWGILITACALPFWLVATPATWVLLFPAYALWGAFGLVNVCGNNLCLKLAPRSDNSAHFALYDHGSGLIAGAAGLLGGWALDQLLRNFEISGDPLQAFRLLFLISWAGRLTAPLWLIPLRQPEPRIEPGVARKT